MDWSWSNWGSQWAGLAYELYIVPLLATVFVILLFLPQVDAQMAAAVPDAAYRFAFKIVLFFAAIYILVRLISPTQPVFWKPPPQPPSGAPPSGPPGLLPQGPPVVPPPGVPSSALPPTGPLASGIPPWSTIPIDNSTLRFRFGA